LTLFKEARKKQTRFI